MLNRLVVILILCYFSSCKKISNNRIPAARLLADYLYLDQIPNLNNLDSIDSILFLNSYCVQWAKEKLLINKAKFNLKTESNYIDSLVTIYKQSLIIHHYKQALVNNYLDTIIPDSLIENYYHKNIDNFSLKESVVQLNYIKVPHVAPNLDFVKNTYYKTSIDNLNKLKDYCIQFATRFFIDQKSWVSWTDFVRQLPSQYLYLADLDFVALPQRKIELKDSTYQYFIFIQDFKPKGHASPLEYVSSSINKILINKRKKEIISIMEKKLLEEAIEKNNFEIYE